MHCNRGFLLWVPMPTNASSAILSWTTTSEKSYALPANQRRRKYPVVTAIISPPISVAFAILVLFTSQHALNPLVGYDADLILHHAYSLWSLVSSHLLWIVFPHYQIKTWLRIPPLQPIPLALLPRMETHHARMPRSLVLFLFKPFLITGKQYSVKSWKSWMTNVMHSSIIVTNVEIPVVFVFVEPIVAQVHIMTAA